MQIGEEVSLGDRKATEGPLPRAYQVKDIEIPDYTLKTVGEESFFLYNVNITWRNATTTQHPKRFSQLYSLHSKLESQFRSDDLPEFPSKERLTSKLSRTLADKRRGLLEGYLRALRKKPLIWASFEVCVFFSLYDLSGKVAIVTGCSAGIGKHTALELAKCGAHVIMACRNKVKTEPIIRDIIQETHNHAVEFMELDLASFASVDRFIADFRSRSLPLHFLVNNAGVGTTAGHSSDGYGIVIQSNHLGHFKLTLSLLDILKASAPARIIHVSSRMHRMADTVKFDEWKNTPLSTVALPRHYGESKLSQVLFSNALARRLGPNSVVSHSLHPGAVNTEIYAKGDSFYKIIGWLSRPINLTEEEGAKTTLYAALSEEAGKASGKYFDDCKESACSDVGLDANLQDQLWTESLKATGMQPAAPPVGEPASATTAAAVSVPASPNPPASALANDASMERIDQVVGM